MRVPIASVIVMTVAAAAAACNGAGAASGGAAANPAGGGIDPGRANAGVAATPVVREITIPTGTRLTIVLDTPVGSDTSRVEERVAAHLAAPVVVGGETVIAADSRVTGIVTDAKRSGKIKGRAHVALRFDSLAPRGNDERYAIRTAAIGRTAAATKEKDALEIGAPAAGGALIGALVGGKQGALIGGAVGGGAGTAVVLSTRGKEVHIPKGTALTLKLTEPVTVKAKS